MKKKPLTIDNMMREVHFLYCAVNVAIICYAAGFVFAILLMILKWVLR